MGDRGQIAIQDEAGGPRIYLYTHWNGNEVPAMLRAALARRERWDDSEYLSRMVFCTMLAMSHKTPQGALEGETGFGIGTIAHGDVHYPIPVLDCATKTILWENHNGTEAKVPESFEDYVKPASA